MENNKIMMGSESERLLFNLRLEVARMAFELYRFEVAKEDKYIDIVNNKSKKGTVTYYNTLKTFENYVFEGKI